MEVLRPSETSVNVFQCSQRQIPRKINTLQVSYFTAPSGLKDFKDCRCHQFFHRYFHYFFANMAKSYGLEDRGMCVQFSTGSKTFLHTVYIDSGVHQTSCPIASGHSFPGQSDWRVKLATYINQMSRLGKRRTVSSVFHKSLSCNAYNISSD
jgi:hypothetical protein